jgi:MFS superfamily sulfate permease-like transporter
MNREAIARRKSLLVAQSHLHRLQARMAWHEVSNVVSPPRAPPDRGDRARSIAATLMALAIPVVGLARLGRIMRVLSVSVMAMRVVRAFRRR